MNSCRRSWERGAREEQPARCRGIYIRSVPMTLPFPRIARPQLQTRVRPNSGRFLIIRPPKSPCREVFVRRFCRRLHSLLSRGVPPSQQTEVVRDGDSFARFEGMTARKYLHVRPNGATRPRAHPLPHPGHRTCSRSTQGGIGVVRLEIGGANSARRQFPSSRCSPSSPHLSPRSFFSGR